MGAPEIITEQHELLTINTNDSKWLEGLLHPGIKVHPLFLDPHNAVWVLIAKFAPGITLPMHFHTGTVHGYTLSGSWYYTEYPNQPQTAGSYLFEPGGSVHQFNTPADNSEETVMFMVVTGANINFAGAEQNGAYMGVMDAGWIKNLVDTMIKDQRADRMRYISASMPTFSR